MSYESPLIKSSIGNTIIISQPTLPEAPKTYLSSSNVATDTTLTVLDSSGFSTDYLVIGKIGLEKTEIKLASAVPTTTTITVAALSFDHPVDTQIKKILWNQVEISGANTVGGSKTVITTINLQVDNQETVYVNTGTTYAYYFVRYYNSTTATYSSYSDPSPSAGYDSSSVRAVKESALNMVNEQVSDIISDQFLMTEILNCEQEVWREKKRWSWGYKFQYNMGDTIQSQYSYTLPTDIADSDSNKSILSIKINSEDALQYVDTQEIERMWIDITHNSLASNVLIGATSITLDDSSDFDDSGSVIIGTDSITYTANDRTTGVLSGCTGVLANHTSGDDVWGDNTPFGQPLFYTIAEGKVYFDVPPSSDFAEKVIYISYYSKPTFSNSDNDILVLPDPTIYHYYLAWKILLKKNNGKDTDESEAKRKLYEARKDNLKRKDDLGQRIRFRPRTNTIKYTNSMDIRVITK